MQKTATALFPLIVTAALFATACHSPVPAIAEADLKRHVETLSADGFHGRESGTVFARATAAYIAREYQRLGLTPAFRDSAGRPSFFQRFEFAGGVREEPGSLLQAANSESTFPETGKAVPLPLGYAGEAQGEAIFLGFCIDAPGWNDFAGLTTADLEGRIAVCLRHGPGGDQNPKYRRSISFRAKYETLVKRKLAGVIYLGREGYPAPRPSDLGGVSSRSAPAVFIEPQPLFAAFDWLASSEAQMRDQQRTSNRVGQSLGAVAMATRFKEVTLYGYNVGAFLRRPAAKAKSDVKERVRERVIVVGAHLDHIGRGNFASIRGRGQIHNGADDNASGTSAVMELAGEFRALDLQTEKSGGHSEHAASDSAASLRLEAMRDSVNVLFLHFDAQERGLFGARHFMEAGTLPAKQIAMMVNLDMVGRLRPDKGLSVQGHQSGDRRWANIIRAAYADSGFGTDIALRLVPGGGGPSDHTAFYTKKIPVAFLFSGGHGEYHTADDDAHLINYAGLRSITEMSGRLALMVAALEPEDENNPAAGGALAYRRAPAGAARSPIEVSVQLGIVADDSSRAAGGLKVAEVRGDAPVAKTGLRPGDVITSIGGKRIGDIKDLMDFLNNATSRKDYAIEFQRDGQVFQRKTRLMSR